MHLHIMWSYPRRSYSSTLNVLLSVCLFVGQASSASAQCAGAAAELLADVGWQLANSPPAAMLMTSSGRCDAGGLAVHVGGLGSRAQDLHRRVRQFIAQRVLPVEQQLMRWYSDPVTKWTTHPTLQQLKVSPSLSLSVCPSVRTVCLSLELVYHL